MPDVYFTYRDNLFNRFVGHRVRLCVKDRKNKEKTYIGTFKAFDFYLNVMISDVYQVVLYHTEEQCKDLDGLLMLRSVNVRCITFEKYEKTLRKWPTKPGKKVKPKKPTNSVKPPAKEKIQPVPVSVPSTKPRKLTRTWLTNPTLNVVSTSQPPAARMTQETTKQPSEEPPKKPEEVSAPEEPRQETSKDEELREEDQNKAVEEVKPESTDDDSEEVKQEVIIKEEEMFSPTFEEFLLDGYRYEDIDEGIVKIENPVSPAGSDMSTSS